MGTKPGPRPLRNLVVTGAIDGRLNGVYVAHRGVRGQVPQFQDDRVERYAAARNAACTSCPYYEKEASGAADPGAGAAIFFVSYAMPNGSSKQRWTLCSPHHVPEYSYRLEDYICESPSGLPPREGWTMKARAHVIEAHPEITPNSGLRIEFREVSASDGAVPVAQKRRRLGAPRELEVEDEAKANDEAPANDEVRLAEELALRRRAEEWRRAGNREEDFLEYMREREEFFAEDREALRPLPANGDELSNVVVTGAIDERLNGVYVAHMGVEGQRPQFQDDRVQALAGVNRAWTSRPYYENENGGAAIYFAGNGDRDLWILRSPWPVAPSERVEEYTRTVEIEGDALFNFPPTQGWTMRVSNFQQAAAEITLNSDLRIREVPANLNDGAVLEQ